MAILTYTEQLESVQTAIAAIESGAQSLEILGRRYAKADIEVLYAREERLLRLVKRELRGGGARVRHCEPT